MTIGTRIKQRREELDISQEELAKRLGYKSRSSINKIELGFQNLTQSKIKAIADALDTTPAFIMGWSEETPPAPAEAVSDPTEQEVLEAFRQLSPEQQQLVLSLLETMK